jgi:hypothetical protein
MDTLVLVLIFGMPAAIFLLALRALVVRLELEHRGALTGARIVEVRGASGDMGEAEEYLTYRFVAAGSEYTGSVQVSAGRRARAVGDTIEVLYHTDRPWFNQPYGGRATDSVTLNVIVMICMILTVFFFLWLLSIPH